jgi:hypothetical protein
MKYNLLRSLPAVFKMRVFVFAFLFTGIQKSQAQGFIYTESFPNSFNTGFTTPIPSSSYTGSSGTWTFSSNDEATVVCNSAFYTSSPYALKLVNYNTDDKPTSTSKAVSPAYNMSAWSCSNKTDLNFKLYTYSLNGTNTSYSLYADFSLDGGTSWTTVWTKTAQQLINLYGSGTWNDISLAIPVAYRTANFKVRFQGVQNAGCDYNSYVFIDDVKLYAEACSSLLSLGNRVWFDANGNGINDSESGIAAVAVKLFADINNDNVPDGAAVQSTSTDADGVYMFNNLAAGNYIVAVVNPAGYVSTPVNGGDPDNNINLDDNGLIAGITETRGLAITLTAGGEPDGNENITYDFGFIKAGSISDRVWNDTDKDGIQDGGEVGVAGITVTLYDAAGNSAATTITDAYGNYLFRYLPVAAAGTNYQVRFSIPLQYLFSPQDQGGNDASDSDPGLSTGRTANILLTPANPDRSDVDAGIYYADRACVGDFIWNDTDKDGMQDAGEPGISGVTVSLYNSTTNTLVKATVTSNNGFYQFCDLPAGSYYIKLSVPPGYQVSLKDATGDAADSDFDPVTFQTAVLSVTSTTINLTIDGGLNVTATTKAALGDKVWEDTDADGLQDANEAGVAAVTVQLYLNGVLTAATATDVLGYYIFNNLIPGAANNYSVKFTLPSGYSFTLQDAGTNNETDSDVNPATGLTVPVVLVADELRTNMDAGIKRNSALTGIGDFFWYDNDKDGVQDAGEAAVPGITVVLYNSTTNAVLATTVTNASGLYLFTGLPASTNYIIGFSGLPAGYSFTQNDAGSNDAADSDVNPATGLTGVISTPASGINYNADAGIKQSPNTHNSKATLGDKVWNDLDNDGIQDANEPGVAGVTVTLYAWDGVTVIATGTTDAMGNFLFTNLNAGTYIAGFSYLPAGYVFASQNAGSNDATDNDANTSTGKTALINLAAGEVNTTIDAGVRNTTALSNLGDMIWYDFDVDGIQDANEPGVAGVTVTLYNSSFSAIKTTVSNAAGNYLFTDLTNGTYYIGFSNLPAGFAATAKNASGSTAANNSDADAATWFTDAVVLPAVSTDRNWDFGIYSAATAALGNFVWNDINRNGIQDAGETGVGGITVTLYNNSGVAVASAVTDASGYYFFANLTPGTYTVGFSNIPARSGFTSKDAAADGTDSDADKNTGRTDAFALSAGQFKTDVDAGLISLFAAVGNYVWIDQNGNGIQDATEKGQAGVTVTLYNPGADGNPGTADDIIIASAVTDGNGFYFINNIPVGSAGTGFFIRFSDLPGASLFTVKNVPGSTADNNSDVNTSTGRTDVFTLLPDQTRMDIDAGISSPSGGALPVRKLVLTATLIPADVVNLNWVSENETNTSLFVVERSIDGRNFSAVDRKNASGFTSGSTTYNDADDISSVNQNNIIYYRIVAMDADGNTNYSNTIAVRLNKVIILQVWPNPFVKQLNLQVTAQINSQVSVRIYNSNGAAVKAAEYKTTRGANFISMDNLESLANGVYMIEVSENGERILFEKLMKQ